MNLFLQCRAITSLPWQDLGETGPITIYIGPTLTREIDRLKGDGSQRRAKRARDANALFRKLLHASDKTMVLQEVGPRVTLTFLPHLDPQREKSPLLDKSIPDDCHIEEALAFQVTHRSTRTAILTHDTGPMLTAGRVGLEPLEIPDAWLLEPEKDESRKQIEELTRQNKLLQSQHAQLSLAARDEHGETPAAIVLSIMEYDPPSSGLVASVLADLRNAFPRQDDFAEPPPSTSAGAWALLSLGGYSRKYQPPLPEEIERYHRAYDAWLTEAEAISTRRPSGS